MRSPEELKRKQELMKAKAVWFANVEPKQPELAGLPGIYAIGSTRYGWFKVGCTLDCLHSRMNDFRSLPFVLDVRMAWPCPIRYTRELERRLHAMLVPNCIKANGGSSEWFSFNHLELRRLDAEITRMVIEYEQAQIKRPTDQAEDRVS